MRCASRPGKGYLFDPDRYPFLEGRPPDHDALLEDRRRPRIADGVIFRVLNNLLVLDGERLSYRTLDVEQIGSVRDDDGFSFGSGPGPLDRHQADQGARCPDDDQPGRALGNQGARPREMAE